MNVLVFSHKLTLKTVDINNRNKMEIITVFQCTKYFYYASNYETR